MGFKWSRKKRDRGNKAGKNQEQEVCIRTPQTELVASPNEVSELLFDVVASVERLDQLGCLDLVQRMKKLGSGNQSNQRCIAANGAGSVLAAAFDAFARDSFNRNVTILEEILSVMSWMFPLEIETKSKLVSPESLRCIVWFLKGNKEPTTKQNSILLLQELVSSNEKHADSLESIEGVNEVLFSSVRDRVSTSMKKASLVVIYHLVNSHNSEQTISEFVNMGMIPLLLDLIVDSERSVTEKALGIFDKLCDSERGREEAYGNALTVPLLTKKVLRVSPLATEFSVSAIWKLTKHEKDQHNERKMVVIDAVQVGAFQKLVLVLQLGCEDLTKEKVNELLKVMNPYRSDMECIESTDFKNLKRSF